MSQPEPNPSRRRPHSTRTGRACNNCRRRRCKCDGVQPTCGTCLSSGHECLWVDGDDGRPPTKQYVQGLRVKIQLLESEIAQLRQANPQASVSGDTPPPELLESPSPTRTSGPNALSQQSYDSAVAHDPDSTVPNLPSDELPVTTQSLPTAQPPPMMYQYIFNVDTSIPVEHQTPEVQAGLSCQWNRYLPDLGTAQLTRLEHDTILSRCFNYGTTWLYGLIPYLFLRDMADCLSPETNSNLSQFQHYSPMLHCSLLALSVAFSDDADINTRTTRDRFAAHAKQWLDQSLEHPTPNLIASLVALSEHHYGLGEKHLGYMYMGIAVRASRIQTNPANPALEDECQWAAFVQEKLMALDHNLHSETPVPKVPIRSIATQPVATVFEHRDYTDSGTECFAQACKLMAIASRMSDNTSPKQLLKDSDMVDIHLQLEAWFNALPEELLAHERSIMTFPHVLDLHLCYWWLILELHLPILDRIQSSEPDPVTELSSKMCDHAADKLIQLLVAFDTHHSLRFFPRNMLKAIYRCGCALLTRHALAPPGADQKQSAAQEGVCLCISALRVISNTWPCAGPLAEELEERAGLT